MTHSAALAIDFSASMIIDSDLLGSLEIDSDELFEFGQGIYGFPACRSFALADADRTGLYWLQSAEHSTLTFLLVDPFLFFEGYAVDLSATDLRDLQVAKKEDVSVLAIVTLPAAQHEELTANLQGPIAFNVRSRTAKQIVPDDSAFGTRCVFRMDAPLSVADEA